jgi:hypothetical protein
VGAIFAAAFVLPQAPTCAVEPFPSRRAPAQRLMFRALVSNLDMTPSPHPRGHGLRGEVIGGGPG